MHKGIQVSLQQSALLYPLHSLDHGERLSHSHPPGTLPHFISDPLQCAILKDAFRVAPCKVDYNLFSLFALFSCL